MIWNYGSVVFGRSNIRFLINMSSPYLYGRSTSIRKSMLTLKRCLKKTFFLQPPPLNRSIATSVDKDGGFSKENLEIMKTSFECIENFKNLSTFQKCSSQRSSKKLTFVFMTLYCNNLWVWNLRNLQSNSCDICSLASWYGCSRYCIVINR